MLATSVPPPHVQIYVLAAAWPRKTLSVVSLRSSTRDVLCAQNIACPYQKSISKPFLPQLQHNQPSENERENKATAISVKGIEMAAE